MRKKDRKREGEREEERKEREKEKKGRKKNKKQAHYLSEAPKQNRNVRAEPSPAQLLAGSGFGGRVRAAAAGPAETRPPNPKPRLLGKWQPPPAAADPGAGRRRSHQVVPAHLQGVVGSPGFPTQANPFQLPPGLPGGEGSAPLCCAPSPPALRQGDSSHV